MTKVFPLTIEKKIILITGGYGHLGYAITNSLLHHGAEVIVAGRSEEKFNEAFRQNEQKPKFIETDISSSESIKVSFSKVMEKFGCIDVLINNAAYVSGQSPENMTDADWNTGIDGSLNSAFRCLREILPYFKLAGKGKIINVSSMYGVVAPDFSIYDESPEFLNPPHYGAAKAGLIQMTKYYASFLAQYKIIVNAVTPGPFPSPKVQLNTGFVERLSNKTLVGRVGQPEDLAGIFTFLSSDAANFITGQNFIVDGGWTVR